MGRALDGRGAGGGVLRLPVQGQQDQGGRAPVPDAGEREKADGGVPDGVREAVQRHQKSEAKRS